MRCPKTLKYSLKWWSSLNIPSVTQKTLSTISDQLTNVRKMPTSWHVLATFRLDLILLYNLLARLPIEPFMARSLLKIRQWRRKMFIFMKAQCKKSLTLVNTVLMLSSFNWLISKIYEPYIKLSTLFSVTYSCYYKSADIFDIGMI